VLRDELVDRVWQVALRPLLDPFIHVRADVVADGASELSLAAEMTTGDSRAGLRLSFPAGRSGTSRSRALLDDLNLVGRQDAPAAGRLAAARGFP
jgi:hypothetical protein